MGKIPVLNKYLILLYKFNITNDDLYIWIVAPTNIRLYKTTDTKLIGIITLIESIYKQ